MSRQDVLVTADWAEKNLGTDGIVFVEVDEDTTAYDGGHLPGAVKINWTTELQDPVRRDIVNKEQFEQLLSSKGIADDDLPKARGSQVLLRRESDPSRFE